MTKRNLSRRLDALETPSHEQYEVAFRRAWLRVVRVLGAALTDEETALVGGGSEAGDVETLIRYRASLPEKAAKKEGDALLSAAYGEAENRGADPWGKEDFMELADALEARGVDASGVRYFMGD
jgi:hypothetical protein